MISAISNAQHPYLNHASLSGSQEKNLSSQKGEENKSGKISNSPKISELSEEEKAVVEQLKKTDQEVKAHEQAHKNAGGQYAGSASFGYVKGPDGKRYAVSGEVPIDIAPVEGDPKATIAKMDAVISAALAPAKPSSQDRNVAARAAALRAKAQAEISQTSSEEGTVLNSQDKLNGRGQINQVAAAYGTSNNPANNPAAKNNTTGLLFDLLG